MSVIGNVAPVGALIAGLDRLSHWDNLSRPAISAPTLQLIKGMSKDTSQLIKGMSKVFQKLLKCLNGTTILRFFLVFVFPCSVFSPSSWFAFDVFSIILLFYLKDSVFVMGSAL